MQITIKVSVKGSDHEAAPYSHELSLCAEGGAKEREDRHIYHVYRWLIEQHSRALETAFGGSIKAAVDAREEHLQRKADLHAEFEELSKKAREDEADSQS